MTSQANPLELLARRLELHVALGEEDRAAVLALPHMMRTYDPSAYLVRDGEPPASCAVLVSGFAFRQKLTNEGTRQIVSLHIPGEALDFQNLFLEIADHNVQTLTRAEVAIIPREAVREIVRARPGVAHAVFVYTLVEASIFREWVLNVGRRDARRRLAHLLCEFAVRLDAQRLDGDIPYELPMTQEQLADALGLTSVHVNRTLRGLEAEGLITRNKRHVGFPRWKALSEVAGFNGRYLHLAQQRSWSPAHARAVGTGR